MAKRRNSPALFELLRDQGGTSSPSATPTGGVAVAPTPAPAVQPVAVPAPATREPKPASAPTPTPIREPEPLSDEPSLDISTPRYVAEAARVPAGTPAMPDLTDLEPEPLVNRGDDGRVTISQPGGMLAALAGGVVVVLVLFGTSLYSLGSHASKEELKPIISDEANRALGDADPVASREPSALDAGRQTVREPVREPIREANVALTPEIPVTTPVVPDPEPETNADETIAAAESDPQPEPMTPSNTDTRVAGLNYMYTSMTFDRDEAERAQQFLFESGFDSIIEEMTRQSDGQKAYRLWTLVGIPGQGFTTSREKFEHERAIFDLGNQWLTEEGGRLDFSRKNQIGWIKYGG